MDYVKFYNNATNSKNDRNYHIHHIDLNRDNNHILNLVRLPSRLHLRYHRLLDNYLMSLKFFDSSKFLNAVDYESLHFENLFYKDFCDKFEKLMKCKIEIAKYIQERNNQLNKNLSNYGGK